MNDKYLVETEESVVKVTFLTKPELGDFKSAVMEVLEQGRYSRRLWLFRDGFNLPHQAIEVLAGYGNRMLPVPAKAAMVMPDELAVGLAHILIAYREQFGNETRTFKTEEAAMAWLLEP